MEDIVTENRKLVKTIKMIYNYNSNEYFLNYMDRKNFTVIVNEFLNSLKLNEYKK